jgi:hypothetical protein
MSFVKYISLLKDTGCMSLMEDMAAPRRRTSYSCVAPATRYMKNCSDLILPSLTS